MAASTDSKTIVLITGANSGIGYELASQLLAKGTYHILLCARSPSKGAAAVAALRAQHPTHSSNITSLTLDVTSDVTITAAADKIAQDYGRLDILVNNAGITAATPPLRAQMRLAFDTNATGPAVVGEAFAPLLRAAAARGTTPRIVNVSSGAGSIASRLDKTAFIHDADLLQYRASKAALNMVTVCQAWAFADVGAKVFAFCPGFTVSEISPQNTAEAGARATQESVLPLVDVLEGKRDKEAGMFLHEGGTYPW
ncbi:uncharacterized protein K452DRAFT_257694 [Aplosporella prunicola CBS 121167]|uniref:NAD(P)-binding protein n=1 Tax=Aplosporella prunicola CBS 121167 TaxID=1176127 RepID=A0A6A6B279_9PEZI|nr:uncharacterized protein K452DRAFT_257694 [Aplosporella prunicola CBS 121167]KAF2137365.1 hypothetical protein K452DRAFT_257694 [Aplosporella prunicola CBS 121167]